MSFFSGLGRALTGGLTGLVTTGNPLAAGAGALSGLLSGGGEQKQTQTTTQTLRPYTADEEASLGFGRQRILALMKQLSSPGTSEMASAYYDPAARVATETARKEGGMADLLAMKRGIISSSQKAGQDVNREAELAKVLSDLKSKSLMVGAEDTKSQLAGIMDLLTSLQQGRTIGAGSTTESNVPGSDFMSQAASGMGQAFGSPYSAINQKKGFFSKKPAAGGGSGPFSYTTAAALKPRSGLNFGRTQ